MTQWSIPKTRFLLPVIGGLALLSLAGAAGAKPAQDPAGEGRRGGLCAQLSCTDTQQEDLRAVVSELRADSKADREAIKRLRRQLAAEFAKDKPDEGAMKETLKKIARHEQEMHDRAFDAMMEIHALLDSSQRAKLVEMVQRHGLRGLMRGGKGMHGKGDGPRNGDGPRKGKGKGKAGKQQ